MKRETIFLGLCSDAQAGIIIWIACVARWGVFTTLTLSEVISRQRRELAELRSQLSKQE